MGVALLIVGEDIPISVIFGAWKPKWPDELSLLLMTSSSKPTAWTWLFGSPDGQARSRWGLSRPSRWSPGRFHTYHSCVKLLLRLSGSFIQSTSFPFSDIFLLSQILPRRSARWHLSFYGARWPRLKLPHARPSSRPNFFSFRGSGPARWHFWFYGARLPRLKLPHARPSSRPNFFSFRGSGPALWHFSFYGARLPRPLEVLHRRGDVNRHKSVLVRIAHSLLIFSGLVEEESGWSSSGWDTTLRCPACLP